MMATRSSFSFIGLDSRPRIYRGVILELFVSHEYESETSPGYFCHILFIKRRGAAGACLSSEGLGRALATLSRAGFARARIALYANLSQIQSRGQAA
jgi:hypothetical protein